MSEKIILDTSNEAASNQKITGWVCRTGHFWGCDERMARYSGATHLTCNCGQVYPKSSYCEPCHEQKRHERYLALPKATWDGVAMLYSDKYDAYFNDTEEVEQFCRTRKIKLTDLDLIICQPNYARPIDINDYLCDELAEDMDAPAELEEAANRFNEALLAYGKPISWSPGEFALNLVSLRMGQE